MSVCGGIRKKDIRTACLARFLAALQHIRWILLAFTNFGPFATVGLLIVAL